MSRPTWAAPPATSLCDWTTSLDGMETGKVSAQSGYLRTSCMARLRVQTDATTLSITFHVDNETFVDGRIGFFVPSTGTWAETTQPIATGSQTQSVVIPGTGLREVWVINAGTQRLANGAWIKSLARIDGTTLVRMPVDPPAAAGLVVYHDSIPIQTESGVIAKESTIGILRASLSDTSVYCEGYGGRGLVHDYQDGFAAASRAIRGCVMATGISAADVTILMAIGTNDFGTDTFASVALWQAQYEAAITRFRTDLPLCPIICQTFLPRTTTVNGTGKTSAQFNAAIVAAEAAVGDANTFVLDGTTLITDAATDLYDGLHLRNGPTLGHAKYAANLITALGLT